MKMLAICGKRGVTVDAQLLIQILLIVIGTTLVIYMIIKNNPFGG